MIVVTVFPTNKKKKNADRIGTCQVAEGNELS